jgi:hypothetical protein
MGVPVVIYTAGEARGDTQSKSKPAEAWRQMILNKKIVNARTQIKSYGCHSNFEITIKIYNELTHGSRYIVLVAGSC